MVVIRRKLSTCQVGFELYNICTFTNIYIAHLLFLTKAVDKCLHIETGQMKNSMCYFRPYLRSIWARWNRFCFLDLVPLCPWPLEIAFTWTLKWLAGEVKWQSMPIVENRTTQMYASARLLEVRYQIELSSSSLAGVLCSRRRQCGFVFVLLCLREEEGDRASQVIIAQIRQYCLLMNNSHSLPQTQPPPNANQVLL